MFIGYDRLILGGTPEPHRTIQWTSGSFGPDVDQVNPDNLTIDWSVTADSGEWVLWNGDDGSTRSITADADQVLIHSNLRISGELRDINLADDTIRLSSFDANDRLELRHSSTDSDQIGFIDRNGSGDYDIQILQGGAEERVFTTADDGTFDADTLDGNEGAYYAAHSESETISGAWDFTTQPSISGNAVATETWTNSNFASATHGNDAHDEAYATESWITDQLVDVQNDGAAVSSNVGVLNFGTDLGASANNGTVTVDYVGSDIPSVVYDDDTEVVSDANGLNFADGFDVALGDNDRADISITKETISGHHTATGDGSTTTFTWDTGSDETLSWANVNATTSAASVDYTVDVSGTEISVTYATPPADGEALGWYWASHGNVTSVEPAGHSLAGDTHSADTLANLNSKVSDATLDDAGTTRPPETHDNAAHSETYAVDGDAQPPESHGNAAHSETYAVDGDAQPPESHGNGAHSSDFAYSSTHADVDIQIDEANGVVNFVTN